MDNKFFWVISGFRRETDKNCALMGYYAATSGNKPEGRSSKQFISFQWTWKFTGGFPRAWNWSLLSAS